MSRSITKGTKVSWSWGNGTGHGTVRETFERRVQRTIQGKRITRVGSRDNPAVLVDTDEDSQVLKRASELQVE